MFSKNIFNRIFASNTKSKSLEHISKHYDLGNEFFSKWLDKTLTYSSAIYSNENENLEEYVSSFIGLRFVVTGRIEGYTRSELEQYIKNRGGSVSSSVSSKTNFVVAGEDAGSKLSDAEKLNVSIISFAELQNLDRQGLH